MAAEEIDDLVAGTQAVAVNVALEPAVDHGAEGLPLGLDRRQSGAHPLQDRSSLLAGRLDRHGVGWTDPGPHLLAAGLAGHGPKALGAARLDSDPQTSQFGVGLGVAGSPRLERGDAGVGHLAGHWRRVLGVSRAAPGLTKPGSQMGCQAANRWLKYAMEWGILQHGFTAGFSAFTTSPIS